MTNKEIVEAYRKLRSTRKVAKLLGCSNTKIYKILQEENEPACNPRFTDEDKAKIIDFYLNGFKKGGKKLVDFSKELNRTSYSISHYAKTLSLSRDGRKKT